jgi:phage repressor protein C with HTH and peptisase S24 domain
MDSLAQREALDVLIRQRGEDYSSLSRLLGRNAAYVQQFIKRGTPKKLSEDDRRTLARYFGVDERELGGRSPERDTNNRMVAIPILDVSASAGPGAVPVSETSTAAMEFDSRWLKRLTSSSPEKLSIIRVRGDSMSPTICDGDEVLVDTGDGADRLRDGIYVLRIEDTLVAKRVAIRPTDHAISILSDNAAYPPYDNLDRSALHVIGRVRWFGRVMQ